MTNIELMKELTQTTYDSVEGYRMAAEKSETPGLTRAFERRRDQRAQTLEQLNTALRSNGEQPITSTSITGKSHQYFLTLTDAFANGDKAVIARVEEGEDYIASQFDKALKNDLGDNAPIRMVVEKAFRDIREGERFSDMLNEQFA